MRNERVDGAPERAGAAGKLEAGPEVKATARLLAIYAKQLVVGMRSRVGREPDVADYLPEFERILMVAATSFPASPATTVSEAQESDYLKDLRRDLKDEKQRWRYLSACAMDSGDALRIGMQDIEDLAEQRGRDRALHEEFDPWCKRIEQQGIEKGREEAFGAVAQRLELVAHGYEKGGHTHRARMLNALAIEFRALAKAGGQRTGGQEGK